MRTVSTNADNDLHLADDGNLAVSVDLEAVKQTTVHYAATAREEMIHAYDEGVPFFQTVFARDVSLPQFEAAERRRILSAPGVRAILSFETIQDGDVLRYTALIESDYGQVEING